MVIGAIKEVHLNKAMMSEDGYADIERAGSACISGLDSYHSTHRIAQFSYAKPDTPLTNK